MGVVVFSSLLLKCARALVVLSLPSLARDGRRDNVILRTPKLFNIGVLQ